MSNKEYCHQCKTWVEYNERNDALEPGDTFTVHICSYCGGETTSDGPRCTICDIELDDDFDFCEDCGNTTHEYFSFDNIVTFAGFVVARPK